MDNVDKAIMMRAAKLCSASYDSRFQPAEGQFVRVEQFQVTGELFGFIEVDDEQQNAYVVFRGTNSKGNWGLTNFQAYQTRFRILDDALNVRKRRPVQGNTFGFPVCGRVHQGFYRGLSWLWYGTEPVFEIGIEESGPYLARLLREAVLIGVPLALGGGFAQVLHRRDFLYIGAICGLLSDLLIIGFERGTWEGLLRKKPKVKGAPLFRFREKLAACQNVWFVGHSLGGALAVLGFALYRTWCQGIGCRDNARIITFGAPRVGDQAFHEDFEAQHSDRFWNVVVGGDPVPETPPSNWNHMRESKIWQRGPIGVWLSALYLPWHIYAWLWGQEAVGEWTQRILIGDRHADFNARFHSMRQSYQLLLETQPGDRVFLPNSDLST